MSWKYGGNVRTFVETTIDGKSIPDITVEEERLGNSPDYKRIKWVRLGQGSNAKFIKAPTKMAQYVATEYA